MRKIIISCALLCALAGAACAQKVEIIMATLAPTDSEWYKVMENMSAEWRRISSGNVNLSIRAGGVAGDEPDAVRRLRSGSIQAAGLTSAGLGDIDLGVAALQIPMMFANYEELDYVRDRIAPKLEKRIEDKGYLVLNWGDAGWVRFFSTKPVQRLDDLRKLKLFTWAGESTEEELWKANGFRVVPLAATDIAQQLETHGIEAVPTTALYAETAQLYKVAKFMCDVKWAPLVGATIVSKAAWEKIPAAQREPMLAAARKSGEALKSDVRSQDTRAIETMTKGQPGKRANTLTVTALDPAALAEWRQQTEAIYPKMKGKMVPPDLFDEVQRLRDVYRVQHPVKAPVKAFRRECRHERLLEHDRRQGPSQMTRVWRNLSRGEKGLSIAAISLMSLLPLIAMVTRLAGIAGIPGSVVFVQQLTLCVAFLGAGLAASGGRLLSMSANTFLPGKWAGPARVFACGLTAAIAAGLCWASYQFVVLEKAGGKDLALGIKTWIPAAVMPLGLLLVTVRAIHGAGPRTAQRLAAAAFVLAPLILGFAGKPEGNAVLWIGIPVVLAGAVVGMTIFATLGGIALLLLWGSGQPASDVPDNAYSLMVSEVLPSLPLFTLSGYLLVEGGASTRLLRVYNTVFGWLPGGLAITTAVGCAIFTWAGSGVTIVSMGGLLLPMLMKARYSERFSIGLINASGSLGLLFPPSLPVILYAVYAKNVHIDALFVGGFVPGLLMVAMVSAFGVIHGIRSGAPRARFSFAEARQALWESKWELAVPVLVIVGLLGGFGTMVEAGAITVAYSLIVECFIARGFSLRRDFPRVALECVTVMGGVLMIIGVAKGLTYYLAIKDVPGMLTVWVDARIQSKYVFLLLLNVVLLIKGSFMDVFSAIIVMVPLIRPIAIKFGIDPVQMGVTFLANLELGYLTPPIGMNLCLSAYRFKQPMSAVYRATLPFYLVLLAGVLLITYVPELTTLPVKWLGL